MKVFSILLLLFISCLAVAGDSIVARIRPWHHPQINFLSGYQSNPALLSLKPLPALSTVRLGYTGSDHRSFHLLQDGEGEQQYGALAAGYKRDGAFDLLGGLTYSHHTTTGIKWSNVTDLDKTGPYILADTLGGTTYGEQYHLWGGASRQLGAHAFHLNLSYRAYGSYRQKDPRASIKVSDFTIGLGWARRIGKHLFGLSAEYNRYRQYASVRNYKDDGRALTNFYVLNGLGFYSDILSGAEYTYGVAYHGAGFNLAFQWIPQAPTGLYLTGQYRDFPTRFCTVITPMACTPRKLCKQKGDTGWPLKNSPMHSKPM